jgi:outer membrane protein assembly factor BamB
VDPVSGAPLWSHPVDPARALHFDPIASSEALFVTFDIDPIQAYDPQTGELLWSRALQRPGAWRSVAADSGRVYVERTPYSTGDETVHLIAMSSSDGATLWARRLEPGPNPELLEPNPVQGISVSPDSVVVAQGTGIEALDPVDGALLWQRDIQGAWGLSGAGRFAFVTRQRPNGTHAVTVLDAATGRRVAGLPIPAEHQVIFVGGRLLWAKGGTIHIWR